MSPLAVAARVTRLRPLLVGRRVPTVEFGCATGGVDSDEPIEMENPYRKPIKKCILCQTDVPLDYKNAQLLSQFVSPYSGRVYGRHITGLCQPMQERVSQLIEKSRVFGYMAANVKETFFLGDPALFRNPLSSARPQSVKSTSRRTVDEAKTATDE